jgi:ribose 1,5-bisphosphokinase
MNSRIAKLYYLAGPSGAGKDSLLAAIRDKSATHGLRVARRYITRPPRPGDEPHIEITAAEFKRARGDGEFLFAWESHGYGYAVGRQVLDWLADGDDVIVNGSRAYLETARIIYPALLPVWITVSEQLLRRRLAARGRESAAQIEARLWRNRELEDRYRGDYPCILNDGPLEAAVARFNALRAGPDPAGAGPLRGAGPAR